MERSLAVVFVFGLSLLLFLGILVVLLRESGATVFNHDFGKTHTIYINEHTPLHVDVADTNAERQLGLGGRSSIGPTEGMLFVFNSDGVWRVWMKSMQFGIDILWLAHDGTVVDIQRYVYPESYPDVFAPSVPARYVLEVGAGVSEAQGINRGDNINLNW